MYDYQTIKKNLTEKTAKDLYCNPEELSSEQKSYVDSMAWELSGLYAELNKSNEYIVERLREKLQPETVNRPIPSHTVVQITPEKPLVELSHEESFDYETGNPQLPPIYFSPLYPTKVFKGEIVFRCSKIGSFEGDEKVEIDVGSNIHISQCWLGLKLDDKIEKLDGLSFYFPKETLNLELGEMLPVVQLEIKNQKVNTSIGIRKPTASIPVDFYETLWLRNKVEEPIYEYYKNQFLTIEDSDNLLTVKQWQAELPPFIESEDPHFFKEPLVWIQCTFPFEVEESFLKNIQINCVPILNRKLIKHEDIVLDTPIKCVPLTPKDEVKGKIKDYFLALDRIYTASQTLQPCQSTSFEEAPTGTYALKFGRPEIPPFDNALKSAYALLELIKRDKELDLLYQIFKVENRSDLETPLREIQKHLATLKNKLTENAIEKPYYFVFFKSDGSREYVFLHYWVTQGVKVEKILFGGKWKTKIGIFELKFHNHF